ncbi:MAG: ribonuclease HII [Ignavibacteria bacterium]
MKQDLRRRTLRILKLDDYFRTKRRKILCGVDEAGRGPIAGPVVAAAVIFGDDVYIEGVYDSKQVLPQKREELFEEIINLAETYAVGIIDNKEIDCVNILNATRLAMHEAISKLGQKPDFIIADGNFYENDSAEVINLVRGDEISFSIAAASIIAKVTRDRIMRNFENEYPNFTFSVHKGYCTKNHAGEILEHGYTKIHRRSFKFKAVQGVLF